INIATRYGQGLHVHHLKPENVPVYTKVILLSGVNYFKAVMFRRALSYLVFYLRFAVTKKFRIVLYIWVLLVSAFGITTAVVSFIPCLPFEKLWTPSMPGHCINIKAYWTANPALNIVFDIVIFVLPIPILWDLKLPKRQRLGLVGVFALG
ncbi:hypothetical protein BKA66DRAFT_403470, partial [Pyrenochaeta sp. MPI-SDFR-AT-0127]